MVVRLSHTIEPFFNIFLITNSEFLESFLFHACNNVLNL